MKGSFKALYGPQSRLGQLTLNIFIKSTKDFKEKAKQIFAKVTSALGFKYIQHTWDDKENIVFTKNINSVEGKDESLKICWRLNI